MISTYKSGVAALRTNSELPWVAVSHDLRNFSSRFWLQHNIRRSTNASHPINVVAQRLITSQNAMFVQNWLKLRHVLFCEIRKLSSLDRISILVRGKRFSGMSQWKLEMLEKLLPSLAAVFSHLKRTLEMRAPSTCSTCTKTFLKRETLLSAWKCKFLVISDRRLLLRRSETFWLFRFDEMTRDLVMRRFPVLYQIEMPDDDDFKLQKGDLKLIHSWARGSQSRFSLTNFSNWLSTRRDGWRSPTSSSLSDKPSISLESPKPSWESKMSDIRHQSMWLNIQPKTFILFDKRTKPEWIQKIKEEKQREAFKDALVIAFLLHSGPSRMRERNGKPKQNEDLLSILGHSGDVRICFIFSIFLRWLESF